ncbi:TIR domain-containing protein [Rodentibacter haemolyticus]|uniref:TIR domain-containing protein n=1 Tax=Rodentibacter haemolyticus TaxID=2778911 RepID=A0ABX6UX26_9PAST|nr:TIR domain-containing protein [Rodentibacter haemolyticus]QPB41913.1 TIR domain-containing protein [Rodentibacter haemolyticus]
MYSTPKHKVFLSFHHADEKEVRAFEKQFENVDTFVSRTVQDGDIDPNNKTETTRRIIRDKYISDSTVTIVLIGAETWKRKHVDWEIGYSLTSTSQNTRSGLIGILLPSYNGHDFFCNAEYTENHSRYTPCTIPPRLYDNIQSGYAKIYSCPFSSYDLKQWIDEAFQTRKQNNHNNNRDYFGHNRPEYQTHWTD